MNMRNSYAAIADPLSELEQLSIEYSALVREQFDALQKFSDDRKMSQQDAAAIDNRGVRIGQIWRLLSLPRLKD